MIPHSFLAYMRLLKLAGGLAAAEAIPFLILTDTFCARRAGWHSGSRFDKAAVMLAVSVGLLSLLTVLFARGRRFYSDRWRHLLLLFAAVSSSVAAGELAARMIRPELEPPPLHGHHPGLRRVFYPRASIVPGVGPEAVFSINSRGIRGPEIPVDQSAIKVLCIGGSTTECLYLDDSKTWSHQLMLILKERSPEREVWVGNMGFSGYSSTMHLRFVERSDLMDQINYLVVLVGFNDLNIALLRRATREERLDNDQRGPRWSRSRLLQLTGLRPPSDEWRIITKQQDTGGTFMIAMREDRRIGRFRDDSPNLDADLQAYEVRLRSIVTGCRAKRVRPLLLTQPVLWSDQLTENANALLWHGWTDDGRFWPVHTLRDAMDRFNDVLVKVCRDMGADCVDLRNMNGNEAFFYDDCHFTAAGAREVARQVSASLHID